MTRLVFLVEQDLISASLSNLTNMSPKHNNSVSVWTDFVKLQRRGGENTLHLLFDATRLPRSLRHSQRGLRLGLVVQER